MLDIFFVVSAVVFIAAYFLYGKFIARKYNLNADNPTPSHTMHDGIDYVPTHKAVLLGHHFSSIAGAGPIVGPIIAALAFGWLPVLFWVIIGSIFIGGVHDFSSLVVSMRHKARSISDITNDYLSPRARRFFLLFVWLALVYVIIVFTDLTAETFINDGGVATISLFYIIIAILFGLWVYKFKLSIVSGTLIFVPFIFIMIWLGEKFPIDTVFMKGIFGDAKKGYAVILIVYCFFASILPVWFLLQPRDYLSSYLLYASVLFGMAGIFAGGFNLNFPPFLGFYSSELGAIFPILFITVACGAVSGFHSLVASGTSSKQIDKETDACLIGYGGMLIEGLVAVIALSTVMMLGKTDSLIKSQPLLIYASGMGRFFEVIGLDKSYGLSFGLLALSSFILTTLDTATRIGRYIFEEFFNYSTKTSKFIATAVTLILPVIFSLITLNDAAGKPIPTWKFIWPLFGATNQLLGALALLVLFIWLKKSGKRAGFILIPMLFMIAVTISSLFLLILKYKFSLIGSIAIILFLLSIFLIADGVSAFIKARPHRLLVSAAKQREY